MRKVFPVVVLGLMAALMVGVAPAASAQVAVGVSVRIGPPPLRVVAVQPIAPGPGYLWTPGYWAYGPAGYYWVNGAWVMAPAPGMLWTPGYWGWEGGLYRWHVGYWGPHVGFYGGVNYGFGYFGTGFAGGRWTGGRFFYNTAVWHVNETVIHTTYVDRTVVRNVQVNRVSFNGGPGGIHARASAEEMRYAQERHMDGTPMQARHEASARTVAARNGGFRPAGTPDRAPNREAEAGRRGNAGRSQERPNAAGARGERGNRKPAPNRDKRPDGDRGGRSGGGF